MNAEIIDVCFPDYFMGHSEKEGECLLVVSVSADTTREELVDALVSDFTTQERPGFPDDDDVRSFLNTFFEDIQTVGDLHPYISGGDSEDWPNLYLLLIIEQR